MRYFAMLVLLVGGCTVEDDDCARSCGMLGECFGDLANLNVDGFDACIDRCQNGGGDGLVWCASRPLTEECRPAEDMQTCGEFRSCIQSRYDLQHEERKTVYIRLAAADDLVIEGTEVQCPEGRCGHVECVEWKDTSGESFRPPFELCDALGIERLWVSAYSSGLSTSAYTDKLPCVEAMSGSWHPFVGAFTATLLTPPGTVWFSVNAEGTLPDDPIRDAVDDGFYCKEIASRWFDVSASALATSAFVPIPPAEQILAEMESMYPCFTNEESTPGL